MQKWHSAKKACFHYLVYLFEHRYAWGQFVLKMFWAPFWGLKEGRKYFLLFSSLPFSYIYRNPLKKIPPRLNWKETASTRVSIIHHASFTDSQVHFQNHTLTPSYSVSHFTPRQKESLVQFPTSPGAHHLHWQISAWLGFRVIHLPRQLCGAGQKSTDCSHLDGRGGKSPHSLLQLHSYQWVT